MTKPMSTEKYPAELVEKVAKATADHNMVGDALNLGYYRTEITCSCGATLWWGVHDGDPKFGDVWNQHIAVAALDALGLTAVWGTRTVGRGGEPLRFLFEANAREDARGFKTELLNQFVTPWEVVTDE